MRRQSYRTTVGRLIAGVALALVFAAMLPAATLFGGVPFTWLTVVAPAMLVPVAAFAFYAGVLRRFRIDIDETGISSSRGRRRFHLPWSQVRSVGVVPAGERGQPVAMLAAWPTHRPAGIPRVADTAPAVFDAELDGFALVTVPHLNTTEPELAAAVELFAPGRWGLPRPAG